MTLGGRLGRSVADRHHGPVEVGAIGALVQASMMPAAVLAADDVLERPPLVLNEALCTLLGLPEQEALHVPLSKALAAPPGPDELARLADLVEGRTAQLQLPLRLVRGTGGEVPVELLLSRVDQPAGTLLLAQCLDMSQREEDARALASAEERLRLTFEHAPIGMAMVSEDGVVEEANNALCRFLRRTRDQLVGATIAEITHPDDLAADQELMDALLAGLRSHYRMDKRYLRPDGSVVWGRLTVAIARSAVGEPLHFISQVQDITDERRREEELRARSLRDPLTQVANRRALFEAYEELGREERRRADRHRLGVLFCDLDRFKEANDEGGHVVGDQLLRMVAQRIQDTIRPEDLLARMGGDEFVVLCRVDAADDALALARRVVRCFDEPFLADGREFRLAVSIGVSVGDPGDDPDARIAEADAAMYRAKRSGLPVQVAGG